MFANEYLKNENMEYPKDFQKLLDTTDELLIGWGNPNANILIVGKEAAIPKDTDEQGKEQYEREIRNNHEKWLVNKSTCFSQEDVVPIQFFEGSDLIKNIEDYNPLYPYKGQLNRVRRVFHNKLGEEIIAGRKGTSKTWHNYQKLSDHIFNGNMRIPADGIVDFHRHFFTTELSDAAAPRSKDADTYERLKSVNSRKRFFRDAFFKKFPIIILAVGNYPKRFGIEYEDFLEGNLDFEPTNYLFKGIYNIVCSKSEQKRLLIHTYQLSMVSDELIKEIADRCIEFKSKNHIKL